MLVFAAAANADWLDATGQVLNNGWEAVTGIFKSDNKETEQKEPEKLPEYIAKDWDKLSE